MNMNANMNKLALAIGAMVVAAGAMAADSGSGTMGGTAAIIDECSVGTFATLTFGNLAMLTTGAQSGTPSASTGGGTFNAICTNNPANTPMLRFTSANTGTSNFRLVGDDGNTYIIYTLATAADVAIAYDTDAAFGGFTADGAVKNLTIKGSIAAVAKAAKKVQAYSDTITIQSSYNL